MIARLKDYPDHQEVEFQAYFFIDNTCLLKGFTLDLDITNIGTYEYYTETRPFVHFDFENFKDNPDPNAESFIQLTYKICDE